MSGDGIDNIGCRGVVIVVVIGQYTAEVFSVKSYFTETEAVWLSRLSASAVIDGDVVQMRVWTAASLTAILTPPFSPSGMLTIRPLDRSAARRPRVASILAPHSPVGSVR